MEYTPIFFNMSNSRIILMQPFKVVENIPCADKLEVLANLIGYTHGENAAKKYGFQMFHDAVDMNELGVPNSDIGEIVEISGRNCFLGRVETANLTKEQKERLYRVSINMAKRIAKVSPDKAKEAWEISFDTICAYLRTE
jgi:hypothetical protein